MLIKGKSMGSWCTGLGTDALALDYIKLALERSTAGQAGYRCNISIKYACVLGLVAIAIQLL